MSDWFVCGLTAPFFRFSQYDNLNELRHVSLESQRLIPIGCCKIKDWIEVLMIAGLKMDDLPVCSYELPHLQPTSGTYPRHTLQLVRLSVRTVDFRFPRSESWLPLRPRCCLADSKLFSVTLITVQPENFAQMPKKSWAMRRGPSY